MAAKKKVVKKKVSKKEPLFYMHGDVCDHFGGKRIVSVGLPKQLLIDYCKAAMVDSDADESGDAELEMEKIRETVSKRSKLASDILTYTASYGDDAKTILNAIKKRKSCGTGECETVAGWGPTKAAAKKEYEALQDDEDVEDIDW